MTEVVRRCQQSEAYAAEQYAPTGPAFDSLEHVQRFVDELRDHPLLRWHDHWPNVLRVEVGPTRRNSRESVGWFEPEMNAGRIELAYSQRFMRVVLHELAHVLAEAEWSSEAHDPGWARTYLELMYVVMGSDAYTQLRDAFEAKGVEHGG